MVAASRKEQPAPVDVRFAVRAELESWLRKSRIREDLDWTGALVKLFKPGFVKLGVAAAFVCMLLLAFNTSISETDTEVEYSDPLVTLYSGEATWSDWL